MKTTPRSFDLRIAVVMLALGACASSRSVEVAAPQTPAPTSPSESTPPWQGALDRIAEGALLLDGLGAHHRAVTTRSPEAQVFFDQGLRLLYAFNHDEAARSFAKAGSLDPSCGMCFWGAANALGPNYNVPMLPDRAAAAWEAVQRAKAGRSSATEVEKALIDAISTRYKGPDPLDPPAQQPFSEAYAAAMREVAKRFPDDLDVQTLFAESLMDLNPWKLWTIEGRPAPGTEEIVRTLESVLARDTAHPGANHYYIHAVEASTTPEMALPSAERLGDMMPGAGHLVHMPAHIFQRIGRYADASEANRKAAVSDRAYIEKAKPTGYYPMYLGHNYAFLGYSAAMEGRSAEALEAARNLVASTPMEMVHMMPGMDFYLSEPLMVMARFGMWDAILAEKMPDPEHKILTGLWRHARGLALVAKRKIDEASGEHATVSKLASDAPSDLPAGLNAARDVLWLAAKVLEGRIAIARGKSKEGIELLWEAVRAEDRLQYDEPKDWFNPVRPMLGAALLDAGKAVEAEAVYREDLKQNPDNGWSLFGLEKALLAQKKKRQAAEVEKAFRKSWARADIKLTRSAF